MGDVTIQAPLMTEPEDNNIYKMTVYQSRDDELFPVHVYHSDNRRELERAFRGHKSARSDYVGILISYRPVEAQVL